MASAPGPMWQETESERGSTNAMGTSGKAAFISSTKMAASASFWECAKLTSVTIGEKVASIGHNAFLSCDNLNSVTFVNPNGWSVDGTALLSDALQNATTAAEYLRDLYSHSDWTRE